MSERMSNYEKMLRESIRAERRDQDRATKAVQKLLEVAGPVWHLGDGDGGWIFRQILEGATERGIRKGTK